MEFRDGSRRGIRPGRRVFVWNRVWIQPGARICVGIGAVIISEAGTPPRCGLRLWSGIRPRLKFRRQAFSRENRGKVFSVGTLRRLLHGRQNRDIHRLLFRVGRRRIKRQIRLHVILQRLRPCRRGNCLHHPRRLCLPEAIGLTYSVTQQQAAHAARGCRSGRPGRARGQEGFLDPRHNDGRQTAVLRFLLQEIPKIWQGSKGIEGKSLGDLAVYARLDGLPGVAEAAFHRVLRSAHRFGDVLYRQLIVVIHQ